MRIRVWSSAVCSAVLVICAGLCLVRLWGEMADLKNVFISHVHEGDAGLQKLKDLLASKCMDVRDSSVHKGKFNVAKDHDYIKTGILAPLIKWAGTFICYVSPQTKNSVCVIWLVVFAA